MNSPRLVSIQVGQPASYGQADAADAMGKRWTTGFFKEPVAGPVHVRRTNLAGDGQADLSVHGGIDKAVLAYSADHYPCWRDQLQLAALPYGAFGENFSIGRASESDICLGDTWQIADVLLEVSQPRQPCWKLARRWQIKQLPKLVVQSGRSGWYLRVLQEGTIEAGQEMRLVDRPHPAWTITRANQAMYEGADRTTLVELMSIDQLSRAWLRDLT